jgi:hypothetical protein
MAIPLIQLVVTCPTCGSKQTTGFNATEIAHALLRSNPVRLYAKCHNISWIASGSEVQAIREHIYKASMESERKNQE